jgi:N-acyl-D-amino-acid deacylase
VIGRILAIAVAILTSGCAPSGPSGTTIANVQIIDGTGSPARAGSVRIVGDSIVAVGDVKAARGDTMVDGHGLSLAPGFIDTHSHHDWGLDKIPDALGAVSQGITTIVAGNDGGHPMPLAATFATLEQNPPSINVAFYAGHGTIRSAVMGEDFKRPARPTEVDSMKVLLQRELDAGALGLSSGLEYDPGINSDRSEVLALAKVAAAAGGRYISHIRSEDRWFWDAIDEIIAIGREAKLPVQISHVKLAMVPLLGKADSLLALLGRARAAGVDITADIYPYPYWQSTLTVLFPKRDFDNRAEAEKILKEISTPEGLLIGDYAPNAEYQGKTVAEIAAIRKEPPAVTLMALIRDALAYEKTLKSTPNTPTIESVVATSMVEPDIEKLMAWDHTNICSDGELDGAHPRGFGAFPRVLGKYVREEKVLPLEGAIRRMTSLAAAHVGSSKRGTIAPGFRADLVLFDPATVADRATTKEPHLTSTGIARVWVNGATVYQDGKTSASRPGRVLKRQQQ